ncbi:MAG: hypothetical protein ABSD71_04705, partial [Bacteroidales bacterium]
AKPIESQTTKKGQELITEINCDPSLKEARYAVLLKPDKDYENVEFPFFTFNTGNNEQKALVHQQKGLWSWYSIIFGPDVRSIRTSICNNPATKEWKGTASIYLICQQKEKGNNLTFTTRPKVVSRPMLPEPFEKGISEKIIKLGELTLSLK